MTKDSHLTEADIPETGRRRRFTIEYKLKILQEIDSCSEPGQIGAILDREGLYGSHISKWRQQHAAGVLRSRAPEDDPGGGAGRKFHARRKVELVRENEKLRERLRRAESVIHDVQRKVSDILRVSLEIREKKDRD